MTTPDKKTSEQRTSFLYNAKKKKETERLSCVPFQ